MSSLAKCLAGVAFAAIGAASASADITIVAGPGNFQNDENVLYNLPGLDNNAPLVQGATNQTHTVVDFFDAGINLTTPSNGQARIEAQYPQTDVFDALTIALDSGAAFRTLIFNLNAADNGKVTITVSPTAEPAMFQSTFDLKKGGENFFRIWASAPETIDSVSFATTVGLQDVRQVRIGFENAVPVPLPAAALPAGALLGLGGLVRTIRGRKA